MDAVTIAALLGIGYLALRKRGAAIAPIAGIPEPAAALAPASAPVPQVPRYAAIGPNSDPAQWWNGIQPGTVKIGGNPAPSSWQPSNLTRTSLGLAGTGIAATEGIATLAIGHTAVASSAVLGFALPIVGIGVGVVGAIVGLISAHHQAALAAEGKALNDANPRALQSMVFVLQAVLAGEIRDAPSARHYLDQVVSDWYAEVRPIQRGTWPYALTIAEDPSRAALDTTDGARPYFGANIPGKQKPNPCNAACVIGHYSIERNAQIVMDAVQNVLAGKHGHMMFPAIGAYATVAAFPKIEVVY